MEKIKLTPKRKEIIELMNFNSIFDVLKYYPYRYDHYKHQKLSYSLHDKKVCFEGIITSKVKIERITKGRMKTSFTITNKDDFVKVVMFNRFANTSFLYEGASIVIMGKYNAFINEISVSNFFIGKLEGKERFTPIYSLPSNIKDSTYRQFVNYVYDYANNNNYINNLLPIDLINKYKLVDLSTAIKYIHNPTSEEQLNQAYRHLKYEEFLSFCLLGALKRKMYSSSIKYERKRIDIEYVKQVIRHLPFKLTNDQKNVMKEILDDMSSHTCMSRLLQGDVGSGKTIVAILSLIANYTSSFQGALMAPTDILARQHYASIKEVLKYSPIKVRLLVSDMNTFEKKIVLSEIENGNVDIVIGTHSLIQESVKFNKLGLAVIDEQHRFGVKQRIALKEKGEAIDVLYMSATPIPRTLASTIYMDMDVSTIASYPYKQRIINTKFINDNSIKSIRKDILSYLSSNQKVYVVCPSIEKSNIDISNVMEIYEKLKKELSPYNVGLLHGKMTASEKEEIMKDFDNGYYQVLVSTTVIEVGINILDANMMIIYNAERFGLASIHQLRGRIARDGKIGYCYLLSDSEDIDAINRLEFISSTNDGFKISEYDLKRRGAGDMLGVAQSGKSPFMVANLIDDFNILKVASEDAKMILNNESKYQEYLNHIRQIIHSNEQFVD